MTELTDSRAAWRSTTWLVKYFCRCCCFAGLTSLAVLTPRLANAQESAGRPDVTESVNFDEYFLPQTMRVDYYHSGDAGEDRIALERVIRDGSWAGSRTRLVDTLDFGLYCFEVRDSTSQRLLYSRGFCSVFGEWQTTRPAKQVWGTYHESLRFPWPKQSVDVVLKRRQEGVWRAVWTTTIDPHSRFVFDADLPAGGHVWTVFENGPPRRKSTCCCWATDTRPRKCRSSTRMCGGWSNVCLPKSRFGRADSISTCEPSTSPRASSGIAQPREGLFRRSALSCQYNTFDLERYVLTFDNRTLRDVSSAAPYDNLIILLNNKKYGGGGIYNDQTTVAADSPFADYILVHEFGHHLAGLGDEYYVSDVAYVTGNAAAGGTVGAQYHGLAGRQSTEMEGPGQRRHAPAHALEEGRVRSGLSPDPEEARRSRGRPARRKRLWKASCARNSSP